MLTPPSPQLPPSGKYLAKMDGRVLRSAGEDAHSDEVARLSPRLKRGGEACRGRAQLACDVTRPTRSEAWRGEGEVRRDAGNSQDLVQAGMRVGVVREERRPGTYVRPPP